MSRFLTLAGLFLTLVGASLLFFYGLPKKKFGNVALIGDIAVKWQPDSWKRDVPSEDGNVSLTLFASDLSF